MSALLLPSSSEAELPILIILILTTLLSQVLSFAKQCALLSTTLASSAGSSSFSQRCFPYQRPAVAGVRLHHWLHPLDLIFPTQLCR
ncbi:hypothetical protein Ahy_A07g037423 isoform G [Arachis hypogaea]|uniref:Uncharacterized protein n=1 Tax=Arachis hypogaea TaxID=3818 RepID=A0A445CIR5_ARAHY|nr:hypothetical protein Ahy_A07g037423 isoform G [Arachis hypogaea]